jgi:hypothetical protein
LDEKLCGLPALELSTMLLVRALLPDGAAAEEQRLCQVGFGQQATTFGSYLLGLDRDLPPPAKLLCDFYNSPTPGVNRDTLLKHLRSGAPPTMTAAEVAASIDGIDPALSKPKSTVVIFKTARSGSTFFTELTRSLMSSAAPPAASPSADDGTAAVVEHWEPFCDRRCYHRNLASLEEVAFSLLLSRCRVVLDTYAMLCPEEGGDTAGEGAGARAVGEPKQDQREGEGKVDAEQAGGEASRRDASQLAPVLSEISETCSAQREAGLQAEASITALNPRFSDRVRWEVLAEKHLAPNTSTIINLRRTNLVRMAYSKFHHQGCGVAAAATSASTNNIAAHATSASTNNIAAHARSAAAVASSVQRSEHRLRANGTASFGLEALLRCTWHYAIGDQEFATATALKASMASGAPLHLVVYEDVLEDEGLVKQNAAAFLGLVGEAAALAIIEATSTSASASASGNSSAVQKHPAAECVQGVQCHSEGSLCSYADVACEGEGEQATLAGLAAYPCLHKQWLAPQEAVWSMPLLGDGSIDLKGDCHRLEKLALLPSRARAVPNLYMHSGRVE